MCSLLNLSLLTSRLIITRTVATVPAVHQRVQQLVSGAFQINAGGVSRNTFALSKHEEIGKRTFLTISVPSNCKPLSSEFIAELCQVVANNKGANFVTINAGSLDLAQRQVLVHFLGCRPLVNDSFLVPTDIRKIIENA